MLLLAHGNIAGLLLQFDLFGAEGREPLLDRRASLEPTQYHYALTGKYPVIPCSFEIDFRASTRLKCRI